MGRLYIETVQNSGGEGGGEGRARKIFKCKWCKVEFASYYDILSKDFQGRFGRAYLFRNVVNISLGPSEERLLEKAYEESQKYKEGMYILEKERMLKEGW